MNKKLKQSFESVIRTSLLEPLNLPTDAALEQYVEIVTRLAFEELVLSGDQRTGLALRASAVACFLRHNVWCTETQQAEMLRLADWAERIEQQCLTPEREPPSNTG